LSAAEWCSNPLDCRYHHTANTALGGGGGACTQAKLAARTQSFILVLIGPASQPEKIRVVKFAKNAFF
jgi:hypothetical protein